MSSPGLVCAASKDNSPHKTVAAQICAKRLALAPASTSSEQPSLAKFSVTKSNPLPLPTVPTIMFGKVQEKYKSRIIDLINDNKIFDASQEYLQLAYNNGNKNADKVMIEFEKIIEALDK